MITKLSAAAFLLVSLSCAVPGPQSPTMGPSQATVRSADKHCVRRAADMENRSVETATNCSRDDFGCHLSEEFRSYIATRRECSSPSDCVVVPTSCPLGCGVAVAKAHAADVDLKISDLNGRYRSEGRKCVYECAYVIEATCVERRCVDAQPEGCLTAMPIG